tara:strand:+ start:335 stop:448 length:114 start_codon:yes stop_codon:yes gene_type:complete
MKVATPPATRVKIQSPLEKYRNDSNRFTTSQKPRKAI